MAIENQVNLLTDADTADDGAIETYLRKKEDLESFEAYGWQLQVSGNQGVNTAILRANDNLPLKSDVQVKSFNDGPNVDDLARQELAANRLRALVYGPAFIGGQPKIMLISRPGQQKVLRGKMSVFGGPNDTGMSPTEGLALVTDSNFTQFRNFFIPGATQPLGRNLDTSTFYLATRWDYSVTPASFLRNTTVIVSNAITGVSQAAQPIDFGPNESTGRVADLSNGLADKLGLKTDDECIVQIPLPTAAAAAAAGLPSFAATPSLAGLTGGFVDRLVSIAQAEYQQFHTFVEADPPLRAEIERFWKALGWTFPGVSTPWSAVFISYCVQSAGATAAEFQFDPMHSVFVHAAIQNALANTGVFRASPIDQCQPKPGDIIQNNRDGGTVTYDQAAQTDHYVSHSAVVVDIGEDQNGLRALTIGGNESDSIRMKRVALGADGSVQQRVIDPYICVIRTLKS